MKKSFFMLGVTAMVLASCTNEEVLNVADSRAISFDNAFVNNSTRTAINGVDDLTNFYVFAGFDSKVDNVYKNNVVTRGGEKPSYTWTPEYIAYWQDGKAYTFDAYAANAKIDNAAVGEDGTLTFSNVIIDGTNDILVANHEVTANITNVEAVPFTFRHTLSQVKFTFKTAIENVDFTITGVSFKNVVNTGSYAKGVWTAASANQLYSFGDISGAVTNDAENGAKSTGSLIILPQTLSETQTVTFNLVATGALDLKERTLTATLNEVTLKGGFSYNFVATLTIDNIKNPDPEHPEEFKPIQFTVSEVDKWTEASDDLGGFEGQN